jgi:penicillin-binding protein 1A
VATCGFGGCPSAAEMRAYRPSEGGRILDRAGAVIGRVRTVKRLNVPLEQVPLHVRQAFVATEDRRFYDHDGVDWRGALRAIAANLRAGGVRQGFSTITMQVARNTFVVERQGERSMARKLIEMRLSRLLEDALTKDQILALYLNVIYLGNGVYGVEGASRDLFGRSVEDLTVAQGAVLAALPKGPSAYTPRRAPRRALARRNLVIALMGREGYLTTDQARRAARTPLTVSERQWRPDARNDSYALDAVRAFVDSIREAQGIESQDPAREHHARPAGPARGRGGGRAARHRDRARERTARGRGRDGSDRSAHGRRPRPRGRTRVREGELQPRAERAPAAGERLQAVRVRRGTRERALAGQPGGRRSDHDRVGGAGLGAAQLRRRVPRRDDDAPRRSRRARTRRPSGSARA